MSNMTAKEAHAILHPDTTAASIWEIKMDVSNEAAMKAVEEACIVACEALAKQIPKKPDLEGDGYWDGQIVYDTWICPCCGKRYEVDYEEYDYCPKCGQKIDWSE